MAMCRSSGEKQSQLEQRLDANPKTKQDGKAISKDMQDKLDVSCAREEIMEVTCPVVDAK